MEIILTRDTTKDYPSNGHTAEVVISLNGGDFEPDEKGPFGALKLTPHAYGALLRKVLNAWTLIHR